jgi:hypothetical protein
MTRIFIVFNPVDPTHQQFSARLTSLIGSKRSTDLNLEVRTISAEDFRQVESLSHLDSSRFTIILDLCSDSTTWRPLINPSCHRVIVGGFAKACLQPLSQASGIQ